MALYQLARRCRQCGCDTWLRDEPVTEGMMDFLCAACGTTEHFLVVRPKGVR